MQSKNMLLIMFLSLVKLAKYKIMAMVLGLQRTLFSNKMCPTQRAIPHTQGTTQKATNHAVEIPLKLKRSYRLNSEALIVRKPH